MCGIVGVSNGQAAERVLIEGLRRLEYRGYDSAGIAVQTANGTQRVRAPGKLAALEAKLNGELTGASGIAHTRWATHGVPNEVNAHPHQAGRVSLVHNGIIENFSELRSELTETGRRFDSETDTEVVAHLIDQALERGLSPRAALLETVQRLDGAFALAAMIDGDDGILLGARQGAPLVAANGGGAGFLASDIMAISDAAEKVMYLQDGDCVVVSGDAIDVFDRSGAEIERALVAAPASIVIAEKGNHRHFMQKEIYEQPEVIGRTLSAYIDYSAATVRPVEGIDFASMSRLLIIACGTASYAGSVAEYWFERLAGLPVEIDIASEFRYREPAFMKHDAALFISQSGETADTLEAMRLCREAGLKTIVLVNTPHSTMAREADVVVPTLAGPEIGVASTKAFTCQLSALAALSLLAAQQRGHSTQMDIQRHIAALNSLPSHVSAALHIEPQIEKLAHTLSHSEIVLYLGRNEFFPLALEGALKLKEISYIHAEGYAAGELKHGPIALIEDDVDVIVIAPFDALFGKTRSSILEVKSRGARVTAITDRRGAEALADSTYSIIEMPEAEGQSAAIIASIAVQLLAYHVAVHKRTDVDQPRNLAKSVTVE